jgi:hypothetical protein
VYHGEHTNIMVSFTSAHVLDISVSRDSQKNLVRFFKVFTFGAI